MRRLPICLLGALLLNLLVAYQSNAQEKSDGSTASSRTFRPVVRGTQYAVSSMKQEATRAAARILESGGNVGSTLASWPGRPCWRAGQSRVHPFRARRCHPGPPPRRRETGVLDQCRGNRTKAGDDRLVQQEQRAARFPTVTGLLSASTCPRRYRCGVCTARTQGHNYLSPGARASNRRGRKTASRLAMVWRVRSPASKKIQKYPTSKKVYFPEWQDPPPRRHLSQRQIPLGCSGSWSKPSKLRRDKGRRRAAQPRSLL